MAIWTWLRGCSTVQMLYLCVVLISLSLPYRVHCEEVDKATEKIIDAEIDNIGDTTKYQGLIKLRRFVEIVTGVKVNDIGANKTLYSDNSLWRNLLTDCGQKTTLSCVKDNVFGYLDHSMGLDGDLSITDNLIFTRNTFVENKYDRKLNEVKNNVLKVEEREKKLKPGSDEWIPTTAETGSDAGSGRSLTGSAPEPEASSGDANNAVSDVSTFEGVTDTLYDKGVRFLASHDLKFQLPEMFGGALLRISPRAFGEDGGALVKLEINPMRRQEEGRFFGYFKEKIKGKIKKKLMMAFLAIILVVKLIKLKVLFLLPMLIGAGAAKKILLKVLLFLFPAFSHLFKFCSYYHGLHAQKYYHHHHQIAHHHHHIPVPVPVHTDHHSHHGGGYSESHGGYPPGPPEPPSYGGHPPSSHQRKDQLTHAQIVQQNENELASWGLGNVQAYKGPYNSYYDDQRLTRSAQPVTEATSYFQRPQPMKSPAYRKQEQLPSPARYPYSQHKAHLPAEGGARQQSLNNLRVQVQTPSPLAGTTVHVAYHPFYSPILQKMDNVFAQLGFNEEACRERLVCSMYKSPSRFSPHSNLISAELSRDPHELQKPEVIDNSAIARFHRYVEAARAGQDMGDCIRLYPSCTVNTE